MDGMYAVEFAGSAGIGGVSLTFKDGVVYGFDLGGAVYDGRYSPGETPGMTTVELAVKIAAGRPSVIRGIVQPFDWTVLAKTEFPTNAADGLVKVSTNMGETVDATFTRMRDVPSAMKS